MHRLAVRIATMALCASALGGCSMLGGTEDDSHGAAPAADNSAMAPDVDTNVRQAQLLRISGDVAGATRIMSQLMLAYPDDARVVGEYGKLLVQEKASGDAVQFLRRAIELQSNDWSTYSALGVAFDQQGHADNARVAYDRALALKPGEPAILNNYAMSRMLAGDATGARTLLMQAKASGSTDPRIASNLALLDARSPIAAVTAAPAPASAVASLPPRRTVASAAMPPVTAQGMPTSIARDGRRIVMQDVPVDPLAGPVAAKAHHEKPSKIAKAGHHAARVAAATDKPAKKPKPAADRIPALRMTADAGRP